MDSFKPEQLPMDLQTLIEYRDLADRQVLFHKGELAQAAFWLESGQVKLLHHTVDGQAVNHYRIQAGESFAEVALFLKVYDCTAIAEAPSRVALLPKQPFLSALRQHPDLTEALMAQLAWRLHQIKILLELRSIRSARDRVLQYLLLSIESGQTCVKLDQPLRGIAEDLMLTPEAISRALSQLEEERIISRQRRIIRFLQRNVAT
jgi:CRP-like cAMP-binding protein